MNGFIGRRLALLMLVGGTAFVNGCAGYRDLVDPCYPQRYDAIARQETIATLAPQVNNGHVLDQTIWNYHFEIGGDKLTPGGMEHLNYLARRRPAPDTLLFLQTAGDIKYDPAAPEKLAAQRKDLDKRRTQAVLAYLNAQTADRHLAFDVVVHDPQEVGMPGQAADRMIQGMYGSYRGTMLAGATAGGAGGASPSAQGAGTAPPGASGTGGSSGTGR